MNKQGDIKNYYLYWDYGIKRKYIRDDEKDYLWDIKQKQVSLNGDFDLVIQYKRPLYDPIIFENKFSSYYLVDENNRVTNQEDGLKVIESYYTKKIKTEFSRVKQIDEKTFNAMLTFKMNKVKTYIELCYRLRSNDNLQILIKFREENSITQEVADDIFNFMSFGTNVVVLRESVFTDGKFKTAIIETGKKLGLNTEDDNEFGLAFTHLIWGPLDPFSGITYSDNSAAIKLQYNFEEWEVFLKGNVPSHPRMYDLMKRTAKFLFKPYIRKGLRREEKTPREVMRWMYYLYKIENKKPGEILNTTVPTTGKKLRKIEDWNVSKSKRVYYLLNRYQSEILQGKVENVKEAEKELIEQNLMELLKKSTS